jgi:hypothetical protein
MGERCAVQHFGVFRGKARKRRRHAYGAATETHPATQMLRRVRRCLDKRRMDVPQRSEIGLQARAQIRKAVSYAPVEEPERLGALQRKEGMASCGIVASNVQPHSHEGGERGDVEAGEQPAGVFEQQRENVRRLSGNGLYHLQPTGHQRSIGQLPRRLQRGGGEQRRRATAAAYRDMGNRGGEIGGDG